MDESDIMSACCSSCESSIYCGVPAQAHIPGAKASRLRAFEWALLFDLVPVEATSITLHAVTLAFGCRQFCQSCSWRGYEFLHSPRKIRRRSASINDLLWEKSLNRTDSLSIELVTYG